VSKAIGTPGRQRQQQWTWAVPCRPIGGRGLWHELRVRAKNTIHLDAVLRRRGIEPVTEQAVIVDDEPSGDSELRAVCPGPLRCDGCEAAIESGLLTPDGVLCGLCGACSPVFVYRPMATVSIGAQANRVKRQSRACPSCDYAFAGARVVDGVLGCPECGSEHLLANLARRPQPLVPRPGGGTEAAHAARDQSPLCVHCRYPLDGLTIEEGRVTCPECNTPQVLLPYWPPEEVMRRARRRSLSDAAMGCLVLGIIVWPLAVIGLFMLAFSAIRRDGRASAFLLGLIVGVALILGGFVLLLVI